MEQEEYYRLLDNSQRRVRETQTGIKRFLYEKIDWRDRLICISGARGTGKTTLILQHIREFFEGDMDKAIYVSLDNLWFETHSLQELIECHYRNGGTHIFIDEVHYVRNWQLIIKNIYDDYADLHIVFTGSSLLKIDADSGDLSRRQIKYVLPGLSFREYLCFEGVANKAAVDLEDLLNAHRDIAGEYTDNIRILK